MVMKNKILLIMIFALMLILQLTFINGIVYFKNVSDDSYTNSLSPNLNRGSLEAVSVMTANREERGYWKIDVSNYNMSKIINVSLVLFEEGWIMETADPLEFYYCPNGFNESTINFGNQNSQTGSCSQLVYRWVENIIFGTLRYSKTIDITTWAKNDSDGVFTIQGNLTTPIPYLTTQMSFTSSEYTNASIVPYIRVEEYFCPENWVLSYGSCELGDKRLKRYTDLNSCGTHNDLPVDNNTYVYDCDFCTEVWNATYGVCELGDKKLLSYIQLDSCGTQDDLPINNNTYVYDICDFCVENWTYSLGICNLNDSRLKTYTDLNSCYSNYGEYNDLPSDNGSYVSCNYCSAQLTQVIDEVCTFNGTFYTTKESYVDNNFYGCCAITNIASDCPTLNAPYNAPLQTICVEKIEGFEFNLDENIYFAPFVEDKVWAKIWLNDTTQNFSCLSYVKTLDGFNVNLKDIVQVNPDYNKKEKAIFSLTSNEYESEEHFSTNRGIGTVYFTKENLLLDGRPYLFGVECSGSIDKIKLTSEKVGYVNWKFFNEPLTRLQWSVGQTTGFLLGFIIIIIIIAIMGWFIYLIKR